MHTPSPEELANLARRWSDAPDFEWVEGMRLNTGERILSAPDREDGLARVVDYRGSVYHLTAADLAQRWPDLTDAATVGALWALLCEAEPSFAVSFAGRMWFASVIADGGGRVHVATAYSRVGALVAAWEAL